VLRRGGAQEDIETVIENIWLTTLGLATGPAAPRDFGELSDPTLDGLINITGDWQGTAVLQVTFRLPPGWTR
jgi:hypothetical protein